MKTLFRKIYLCFKGLGYAKAAADLARNGKYKQAQNLMKKYGECKWIIGYLWPMKIGIGLTVKPNSNQLVTKTKLIESFLYTYIKVYGKTTSISFL